ncbi:hypothetical protein L4D13_18370 [Photobacterium profundum]|uniref:hypothetical protein n=1 Tax=Photobacterium profundum TaxID=74109 RepID=UPI003D128EF6
MDTQIRMISTKHNVNLFFVSKSPQEELIEKIDYILQNGSNAQGVQRTIEEIIPEIEELLGELKEKIKKDKEKDENEDNQH